MSNEYIKFSTNHIDYYLLLGLREGLLIQIASFFSELKNQDAPSTFTCIKL